MNQRLRPSDLATARKGPSRLIEATNDDQKFTQQIVELVRRSNLTIEQAAERTYKGQRWINVPGADGINRETVENPAFTRYLDRLRIALG